MYKYLFLALLPLSLSAAPFAKVMARSESLSPYELASVKVRNPLPICSGHYCGQQIVIEWSQPCCQTAVLELSFITAHHFHRCVKLPVYGSSGIYTFRLLNTEYRHLGAILTYKIILRAEGQVIASWHQRGWVDWITF